eukprot:m.32211 g.32211  ORF g.32211 m.32211 type:complete len:124 (-) comp10763_c0_seq2:406-777(-)
MPAQQKAKTATKKYTIDFSKVVDDSLLDLAEYERFLHERIKVNGKTGQLAGVVTITTSGSKVTVQTKAPFPKRYLKYLTKKFLKRTKINQEVTLREYLRVVATNATTYEVRYFNMQENEEEED